MLDVRLGLALVLTSAGWVSMTVAAPSPLGTWLTESGHGVIAIEQCGATLCGRIVGIDRKPGEPMPTDVNGRSQCGLTIISKGVPSDDGGWRGEITDPRSGNIYNAKIWIDEDGNLRLRGYIGIPLFGQTQVWRPYTGRLTADCAMA